MRSAERQRARLDVAEMVTGRPSRLRAHRNWRQLKDVRDRFGIGIEHIDQDRAAFRMRRNEDR